MSTSTCSTSKAGQSNTENKMLEKTTQVLDTVQPGIVVTTYPYTVHSVSSGSVVMAGLTNGITQ